LAIVEIGGDFIRVVYTPNVPTRIGMFTCEPLPAARPVASLRDKINDRISEKRLRLASDARPRILVLGNLYIPAGRGRDYSDAFAGIEADDFAALVVVHSRGKVRVLAWRLPPSRNASAGSA
jgi:hypothetical protein